MHVRKCRRGNVCLLHVQVGKCTWHTFGPSGTIQDKDALCVLPLNIVNEKVYVLLWLTYIILVAVTALVLVYHIILLSVSVKT